MARGLQDLEPQSAELKALAVPHRSEVVLGLGASTEMDPRARLVPELKMTGHEVGVEMGEKDVPDLESMVLGINLVLACIPLGIDHYRRSGFLVTQEVGSVGETAEIVLLEDHL